MHSPDAAPPDWPRPPRALPFCLLDRPPNGARVTVAGLVLVRQRPGTAKGVIFVTLEDETGYLNLIVWQNVAERERSALLGAKLLGVRGRVQKEGEVLHVVAEKLHDYSGLLGDIVTQARNFH